MYFRVVILVFAAACCTARVIDVGDDPNMWEKSGKFEGDIVLTEEQQRNGLINTTRRWPGRRVPFYIDPVFTADEIDKIMLAAADYEALTIVRLVRYNSPPSGSYIHVTGENTGCWSYVGRKGGRQELNLQRNLCLGKGTVIHEFLHALGFVHMHSATNRDNYVTISWANIQPGKEQNFNKYPASEITSFGVSYDYDSVTHYSRDAFTVNGYPTITPKVPNANIGQRVGFSKRDIQKLDLMYL